MALLEHERPVAEAGRIVEASDERYGMQLLSQICSHKTPSIQSCHLKATSGGYDTIPCPGANKGVAHALLSVLGQLAPPVLVRAKVLLTHQLLSILGQLALELGLARSSVQSEFGEELQSAADEQHMSLPAPWVLLAERRHASSSTAQRVVRALVLHVRPEQHKMEGKQPLQLQPVGGLQKMQLEEALCM